MSGMRLPLSMLGVAVVAANFVIAEPPTALPVEVRRALDRPVATHLYDTPQKMRQRATLWEHVLKPSETGISPTTSVVVLTCGFDRNPTGLHHVAWAARVETCDGYVFTEDSSWDIVYHPATKRLYVVRLLSRAARGNFTLDIYAVDPETDLLRKGVDVLAPPVAKELTTPEPLGTVTRDIPRVARDSRGHVRVVNPKLSARGNVLAVSFSRTDDSQPISHSFDLSTGTWDKSEK